MGFPFKPFRMVTAKKDKRYQTLVRMRSKGNPRALLMEKGVGAATVETVRMILKQLKIEPSCETALPLSGIYLKKIKSPSQRCSLQHFAQ